MGIARPCAAQLLLCHTFAASHPFGAAQMLTVGLGDGGAAGDREYPAEVLNTDADNDLAVLRIAAPPSDLPALECVSSRPHPTPPPTVLALACVTIWDFVSVRCQALTFGVVCDPRHIPCTKRRHAAQAKMWTSHAETGRGNVCMLEPPATPEKSR